ncbi:MAG: tetratricopeptide repeat protein [Mesotoga sp.]
MTEKIKTLLFLLEMQRREEAKALYGQVIEELGLKAGVPAGSIAPGLPDQKHDDLSLRQYLTLANVASYFKEDGIAEALLEECYNRWPEDVGCMIELAYIYKKLGKYSKSELMYRVALSYESDNEVAVRELGLLYMETERPLEALCWFHRLLRLCPVNPIGYFLASEALERLGKKERSRKYLLSSIVMNNALKEPVLHFTNNDLLIHRLGESVSTVELLESRDVIEEWLGGNR